MRPPLAGKRAAARRLAAQVRHRLEPVERVLPVRLPGVEGAAPSRAAGTGGPDAAAPVVASEGVVAPEGPTPEDAAARIDAARERLRASIEPPDDPDA